MLRSFCPLLAAKTLFCTFKPIGALGIEPSGPAGRSRAEKRHNRLKVCRTWACMFGIEGGSGSGMVEDHRSPESSRPEPGCLMAVQLDVRHPAGVDMGLLTPSSSRSAPQPVQALTVVCQRYQFPFTFHFLQSTQGKVSEVQHVFDDPKTGSTVCLRRRYLLRPSSLSSLVFISLSQSALGSLGGLSF